MIHVPSPRRPSSHRSFRVPVPAVLVAVLALVAATACGAQDIPEPPEPPEAPGGSVEVTGVLTGEGVECPALRATDGTLYTLVGDLGEATTGDAVRVRGREAEISICQQGITLEVEEITVLEEPPTPAPPSPADPDVPGGGGEGDGNGDTLRLTGVLTDEGVECPAFRAETVDGEPADRALYTLTGDLQGHGPGDRVTIVAAPVGMSFCMQGTTVEIRSIAAADGADGG